MATLRLDDLDLESIFQRLGQSRPDMAAASDDQALDHLVQLAQFADDGAGILAGGDENLVVGRNDGVAFRNDRPALAEDGGHPGIDTRHVLRQGAQRLAHQRAAFVGLDAHQPNLIIGEIQHLQGTGMLDDMADVVRHQLFGADQHIDRQRLIAEQAILIGDIAPPEPARSWSGC